MAPKCNNGRAPCGCGALAAEVAALRQEVRELKEEARQDRAGRWRWGRAAQTLALQLLQWLFG